MMAAAQDVFKSASSTAMPSTTLAFPLVSSALYVVSVVLLMKKNVLHTNGKPKLPFFKALVIVHNIFLALLSVAMLTVSLVTAMKGYKHYLDRYTETPAIGKILPGWMQTWIYPTASTGIQAIDSMMDTLCDADYVALSPLASRMFRWSKYYEFVDTFILLSRGKNPVFLHVYHHAVMVPLTHYWAASHYNVHWFAIVVNSGVHVLMYTYYALAAAGYSAWWKKYLTSLQLVQFAAVFTMICGWTVRSIRRTRVGGFIYITSDCPGGVEVDVISAFVDLSFLFLFAHFYFVSYIAKAGRHKKKKKL